MKVTLGEDRLLHTTLYVKPNTKNQLLLPSSAHPPFVTRSSAFSLFLRNRRICSDEEAFQTEADRLESRLMARCYSKAVVAGARLKASNIPRGVALEKVVRGLGSKERQHRLVCKYDRRSSPALQGVMEDGYQAASRRDVRFHRWFPNTPKPAFKRGKTLKDELVRAKLPTKEPRTRGGTKEGVGRCNKGKTRGGGLACSYLTERPAEVVTSVEVNKR